MSNKSPTTPPYVVGYMHYSNNYITMLLKSHTISCHTLYGGNIPIHTYIIVIMALMPTRVILTGPIIH